MRLTAILLRGVARLVLVSVPCVLVSCTDDKHEGSASAGSGNTAGMTSTGGATAVAGATATAGVTSSAGATASAGATSSGASGASAGVDGTKAGAGGAKGGAGGASGGAGGALAGGGANAGSGGANSVAFALTSPNHMDGSKFANKYTCTDKGFNGSLMPELNWTDGPAGTKSYAITFIDVSLTKGEVPGGMASLGYHWVVYNIPANVHKLPEALTDMQATQLGAKESGAFLGPCPNFGSQGAARSDKYEFTVYALASSTSSFTGTSTALVKDADTKLEANNLGKAKLTGTSDAKPP